MLPDVPGGADALAAFERNAMYWPSGGVTGVNWPAGPRLVTIRVLLPGVMSQPSNAPDSKLPFFSRLITMSPTSVVPPITGAKLPEMPVRIVPPMFADAVTEMLPSTVATPEIENVPSPCVVADFENAVTVAPPTGVPFVSRTRPITVVPGSGITFTSTSVAAPVLPARSTAVAPSVRLVTPSGTLKLNRYGADVAVNTFCPLTKNVTPATATSSEAATAIGRVMPSTMVVPGAGEVIDAVGATPFVSTSATYWPIYKRPSPNEPNLPRLPWSVVR